MLEMYQELRLSLGSSQYYSVALHYENLCTGEEQVNLDLKKIMEHPKEFKKEIESFFSAVYRIYTAIRISKRYKDLDPELVDEADIYDEDYYNDLKEMLFEDPFKFPIQIKEDTALIKLAIIEWFKFVRGSAWDLWSAVGNLNRFLETTGDYDYYDNEKIAEFLYTLKVVYDFTDSQIQNIAGDFDT
jgi:hypothetical protein